MLCQQNYAAVDRGGEYKQLTGRSSLGLSSWMKIRKQSSIRHSSNLFVHPINAQNGDLCQCLHSKELKMKHGNKEPLNMKNVVLQRLFLNGNLKLYSM